MEEERVGQPGRYQLRRVEGQDRIDPYERNALGERKRPPEPADAAAIDRVEPREEGFAVEVARHRREERVRKRRKGASEYRDRQELPGVGVAVPVRPQVGHALEERESERHESRGIHHFHDRFRLAGPAEADEHRELPRLFHRRRDDHGRYRVKKRVRGTHPGDEIDVGGLEVGEEVLSADPDFDAEQVHGQAFPDRVQDSVEQQEERPSEEGSEKRVRRAEAGFRKQCPRRR